VKNLYIILAAVVVTGLLIGSVKLYGDSRYREGVSDTKTAQLSVDKEYLAESLKTTLTEIQQSQAMWKELASLNDPSENGPALNALVNGANKLRKPATKPVN